MPVFMGWMKVKAEAHARAYPDKLSLDTVDGVKTFSQFNSRITSPVFDFSSPEVRTTQVRSTTLVVLQLCCPLPLE